MDDPETECIVMIGEIGGELEADAAKWIQSDGNRKPVVGFIAGETAPKGRTMGHAGAIVGGSEDTAEAKKRIMRECGLHVVDSPCIFSLNQIGMFRKQHYKRQSRTSGFLFAKSMIYQNFMNVFFHNINPTWVGGEFEA